MLEALENLDPAYIEAAAVQKVRKTSQIKKWGTIAACLVLLLSAGFGTYAYAAEVKEYNAAVRFFGEYDLPTEGLTRGDIKAVYRDISTQTFHYSKTEEVIENSLTPEQKTEYKELKGDQNAGNAADLWEYKIQNTENKPTTTPTTTPTTAPTKPTAPLVEPIKLNTIEDAQQLLTNNYWYWRAVGCTFEKPGDLPAKFYFYSGLRYDQRPNPNDFTAEEKAHLAAAWEGKYGKEAWKNAAKMPVAEINKAMTCLGVTIRDIGIPEEWVYYEKTDSYYFFRRTDAYGLVGHKVTELEKFSDGIVKIYWEVGKGNTHYNTATGEFYSNGVKYVMTLQEKTDGSYLILSNVPVKTDDLGLVDPTIPV